MSKGKVFDPVLLTRIIRYVKPYKKTFAFTGFLTLLLGLLGPVRPIIIQYTLDNAILNPNTDLLFVDFCSRVTRILFRQQLKQCKVTVNALHFIIIL